MHIALLASDAQLQEFMSKPIPSSVRVTVADSFRSFEMLEADVYFDLSFEMDVHRRSEQGYYQERLVFINAVCQVTKHIRFPVVRMNGWPTFLQRELVEIAVSLETLIPSVKEVFETLGWKYMIVPDIPGFITGRVVASLINEAYFALGDQVSSKSEIDIAMKLGTNYPYGPFEWSEKIGLEHVEKLLRQLSVTDPRYEPAPAMTLELFSKRDASGDSK